MYKIWYLILTLLAVTLTVNATPLVVLDTKNVNINHFELEYFIDENEKMLFGEVKKQEFHKV